MCTAKSLSAIAFGACVGATTALGGCVSGQSGDSSAAEQAEVRCYVGRSRVETSTLELTLQGEAVSGLQKTIVADTANQYKARFTVEIRGLRSGQLLDVQLKTSLETGNQGAAPPRAPETRERWQLYPDRLKAGARNFRQVDC